MTKKQNKTKQNKNKQKQKKTKTTTTTTTTTKKRKSHPWKLSITIEKKYIPLLNSSCQRLATEGGLVDRGVDF